MVTMCMTQSLLGNLRTLREIKLVEIKVYNVKTMVLRVILLNVIILLGFQKISNLEMILKIRICLF